MLVSDSLVDSSCFEHSQPCKGSWERSPPQAPYSSRIGCKLYVGLSVERTLDTLLFILLFER